MSIIRHGDLQDRLEIIDAATASIRSSEGESAVQEPVRREGSFLRRPLSDEGDVAADSINARIQRVSGQSVTEIDRVIGELTHVRDLLKKESDRVQREITGYTSLSQSAMTSMKVIADSLTQCRPGKTEARRA